MTIAVLAEAIGVAVDLSPLDITLLRNQLVIIGTVVVTGTQRQLDPYAVYDLTVLFELIGGNSLGVRIGEGLLCYGSQGLGIEVIPLALDLEPAACQLAELGIMPYILIILYKTGVNALRLAVVSELIVLAVDLNDTGDEFAVFIVLVLYPACCGDTVDIELAVGVLAVEQLAAVLALKDAFDQLIGMTGSGNNSTPFNNRITFVTESTSGITALCAGSSLVGDSMCSVLMQMLFISISMIAAYISVLVSPVLAL